MSSSPIRVVLVDDHLLVLEGLRLILAEQPDIEVVASIVGGDTLLSALRPLDWQVLVLDVFLGDRSGLELIERIREHHPERAVLMLSSGSEAVYGLRALRAGAHGFVSKSASADALLQAIRAVAGGQRYASPALVTELARQLGTGARVMHTELSQREFQVLIAIADGRSVVEVGRELCISPKTVSTYRTRLLGKLGLETTADLVRYALDQGLAENA